MAAQEIVERPKSCPSQIESCADSEPGVRWGGILKAPSEPLTSPRFALVLAALLVPCTPALAQGADVCASAQAIAGTGVFAFDNSAATTDGVPDALCNFFAQTDITSDV